MSVITLINLTKTVNIIGTGIHGIHGPCIWCTGLSTRPLLPTPLVLGVLILVMIGLLILVMIGVLILLVLGVFILLVLGVFILFRTGVLTYLQRYFHVLSVKQFPLCNSRPEYA